MNESKFTYQGYISKEAEEFFGNKLATELRDGLPVMGFFIKLQDGSTIMPNKGDVFTKNEDGNITVKSTYR